MWTVVWESSLIRSCRTLTLPHRVQAEGSMITLVDIIILVLAYAGLSLSCGALIWLLRTTAHQHADYEELVTKSK
jgi:hypothetical protein